MYSGVQAFSNIMLLGRRLNRLTFCDFQLCGNISICNAHIGPRILSPLFEKASCSIHYPNISPPLVISHQASFDTSFQICYILFTLHSVSSYEKIQSIEAGNRIESGLLASERSVLSLRYSYPSLNYIQVTAGV